MKTVDYKSGGQTHVLMHFKTACINSNKNINLKNLKIYLFSDAFSFTDSLLMIKEQLN